MSSKKSVSPSLHQLISWCSDLHADDWKFVQKSVLDANPLLRMHDINYYVAKQLQEFESRLTLRMAESLAESEHKVLGAVQQSHKDVVAFLSSPSTSSDLSDAKTLASEENIQDTMKNGQLQARARRFKVLVYGLVGVQRKSITDAFLNTPILEIRAAERTSRPPVGDFDLVVCSKFIPHSATDSLKARNPQCKVIFAGGGTSSIIREINSVVSSLTLCQPTPN